MSIVVSEDEIKDFVVQCLEDRKAMDIAVLDLRGKTEIAAYIVIASGTSSRSVTATADFVSRELKNKFHLPIGLDGMNVSQWVVLDAGDVLVHVMHHELREVCEVEKFWKHKK